MAVRFRLSRKGMFLSLGGMFLLAILAGVAIWLVQRTEQVAPDDSAAGICCNSFVCSNGQSRGDDPNYLGTDCSKRWEGICDGDPVEQGNQCSTGDPGGCGAVGEPCCDVDGHGPPNGSWDHGCASSLQCLDASGTRQANENERGVCGRIGGTDCQGNPVCDNMGCRCENSESCSYQTAEFNCPFDTDDRNRVPVSCNDSNGSSGSGRGYCVTMQYDVTGCRGTNANVVWVDSDGTRCSSNDASRAGASDYLGWCLQQPGFDISACAPPPAPFCGDGNIDPGEACDPASNSNSCQYGACNSNCTCPQQPPPSCGDGVIDTNEGEECDMGGGAANTCEYGTCQADCLCPDPNPNWEIEKQGTPSCSTTGDPYADVEYTVVVTNTGTTMGTLETVVDTLDPAVQPDWIVAGSIIPQGTVGGNMITWTVNQPVAVGASMTFRYTLRVPRSAFGTIANTVTATPVEGDPVTTTENVVVSCTTPQTGLFDSTRSKVIAGVIMMLVSGAYLAFDRFDIISVNALHSAKGGYNKRFGKDVKVGKSRKRFESGWDD